MASDQTDSDDGNARLIEGVGASRGTDYKVFADNSVEKLDV